MISVFFTCYLETGILSKHLTSVHVVGQLFLSWKPRKRLMHLLCYLAFGKSSFFVMGTHDTSLIGVRF